MKRLVSVVRSLGIEVIAEGVESPEDKAVVFEAGVGYAQGYLWGQPD
ncbi:MAG: EAL domain-containing protein [Thermodesulfobacteriota bacterium]